MTDNGETVGKCGFVYGLVSENWGSSANGIYLLKVKMNVV